MIKPDKALYATTRMRAHIQARAHTIQRANKTNLFITCIENSINRKTIKFMK